MANKFIDKLQNYAQLTPEAAEAVARATSRPWRAAARRDLIREGDRPGPVFIILEGWAFHYKILSNGSRQVMAFMMPGDTCDLHAGMLAEMDHGIQTATSSLVATISRDDMDHLLQDHASFSRAMYISQLADQGILRAWIVSMGRRSSIERVAHLMCELYLRAHGLELLNDAYFDLPLSQVILADALGMTPVHINRVLKELRMAGAMQLRRGGLVILDPIKLVQIAGFDENYLHRRMRQTA